MSFLEIFLIGLGLSMDCFAVSLSLSVCGKLQWKDVLKTSAFFGIFQGIMPVIGWVVGSSFQSLIQNVDHWLAFVILAFIGIRMVSQFFVHETKRKPVDIRKTSVLLTLSVATSIDALATGISFGFIKVNILEAASVITVITFIVSVIGSRLGAKSTFIPAKWAELLGGFVLIAIGTKILLNHLGII
ncbi:MAG: manganese efflux pump MntP family protein [Bacteroidetes bacterium]|nr:manganese efflux pump MntP family protein [Bacteroidota bacterium]